MIDRIYVGHPVDVASGILHKRAIDVELHGRPKVVWDRRYSTALLPHGQSLLGVGWVNRYFAELTRNRNQFAFTGPEGDRQVFVDSEGLLESGKPLRTLGSFQEISRLGSSFAITRWGMLTSTVERFVFVPSGSADKFRLAAIETLGEKTLDLAYDESGLLRYIRQSRSERGLMLGYDSARRISTISLAVTGFHLLLLMQYDYDSSGFLIRATDALGQSETYEYDNNGRMVSERLKGGVRFEFLYDAQGRCVRTSGDERFDEKTLKYLPSVGWTVVTDSNGSVTKYQWNENGQVLSVIRPLGGVDRYEYDKHGRLISRINPNGATFQFRYDRSGNCTTRLLPIGRQIIYEFNEAHVCTSYTDANGRLWERQLDETMAVVTASNPSGATWSYEYDANGYLSSRITPDGRRESYLFNSSGDLLRHTNTGGFVTTFGYDSAGRLIEVRGPNDTILRYGRDPLGRVVNVRFTDDSSEEYRYDAAGNLIESTDAGGKRTTYKYGHCGRLVSRTDACGLARKFNWGTEPGQLVEIVNELGQIYRYEYDEELRIVREVGFSGESHSFTYDFAGFIMSYTDAAGDTVKYERRADGWPVRSTFSDGTEAAFSYDAYGALLTACNQTGELRFERDASGRVVKESQCGITLERQYDAAGRIIEFRASTGYVVMYRYDAAGRVCEILSPRNRVKIQRTASGKVSHMDFGSGISLQQSYDANERIAAQKLTRSNTTSERTYTHDITGCIASVKGKKPILYMYDCADRVASIIRDNSVERYEYDAVGNISLMEHEGRRSYRFYSKGDRILRCAETFFRHDNAGRMVEKSDSETGKSWHYNWNPNGDLISVANPEGRVWKYAYDAIGRRLLKVGPEGETRFIWQGSVVVQEIQSDASHRSWLYPLDSFTPLLTVQGGSTFAVVSDQVGLPTELISLADGHIAWAASYFLWGGAVTPTTVPTSVSCPHRFQGQWYDEETGLCYNRFRYYDPVLGRYISPDPIRMAGSANLFAYVSNPLLWFDLYGLAWLYRGMKTGQTDSPQTYSGPSQGGQNAANALGVRPGEAGMSTNTDPNSIPPQRRPPEFGSENDPGTQKNSAMYRIDDEQLAQHGLVAINDHGTHFEIRTAEGIPPEELPERLAASKPMWQPISREEYENEKEEKQGCS